MKTALLILAHGFEEIEAVTICDVLRRGDIQVTMAGIGATAMRGAHDIIIQADVVLADVGDLFDAIILPGGMGGTENLLGSADVTTLLKRHAEAGKLVAAICAAPWVLARADLLAGVQATIYPGLESKITGTCSNDRVVQDGMIITSRGPATAMEFSLALVQELVGEEMGVEVGKGLLYYP
ncbi:MAG: DJ-1/PfpI family protein [Desulfobulbaceae bacterium]|jgi:4-methyl-5(b-hydroxyethyl)-thiazole monophosphate biosynthesis|nr:DJ-1/PfpI family protein [Desulfobulbaceae bacterium]